MIYRLLTSLLFLTVLPECFAQQIKNQTPVFTSVPKTRIAVDSVYSYAFHGMDSAGRALKFSVQDLPSWLSYSPTEHKISGRPDKAGQYLIHIHITNGVANASQHFMLTAFDEQTTNILPLGNSITNGTDSYNSYRRPLWKMLHQAKYNFDLIGSWSGHHMGGEVPDPDFDTDHEGHSGWTYEHLFSPPDWDVKRGNIQLWLQSYKPGLVLLELGTNDVFQCRPADDIIKNLSSLIRLLRNRNENVKIFIGTVIPLGSKWSDQNLCGKPYRDLLKEVNERITGFVRSGSTLRSPLILVDQFSGIDPQQHLYDDIHPNEKGEEIMAKKWVEAIRPYLKLLR